MTTALKRLLHERSVRGASAVEYGLLVAAIAAVIAVTVFALGGAVRDTLFEDTCNEIVTNTPGITSTCG